MVPSLNQLDGKVNSESDFNENIVKNVIDMQQFIVKLEKLTY
jgi:hypothetical protein